MSGGTIVPVVHSPTPSQTSSSSTLVNMEDSERQPSGSGKQTLGSGSKSRKCKRGRSESTNELFEKMIAMQKSSDQMMMSLEEKRIKMGERQMELDAQMCHKERQFQLQMMQVLPPPTPHYPMHSTFNFGSVADHGFDPDETQDGL